MMKNTCITVYLLLIVPPVFGQTSHLRSFIFKHITEAKTWSEAQAHCRNEQLDLITVQRPEQQQLISTSSGWIGLYRENATQPWKWSRENETATIFNWYTYEPNLINIEFCVGVLPSGRWANERCEYKKNCFCYRENLFLVKKEKTWEEALQHCRSYGIDPDSNKPLYDLATLISEDDHNYARERAQEATTDEVWTGLRFLGDRWYWMSGQDHTYQEIPSCPDFHCGVLEKKQGAAFGIRRCSEKKNFFCYKTP